MLQKICGYTLPPAKADGQGNTGVWKGMKERKKLQICFIRFTEPFIPRKEL